MAISQLVKTGLPDDWPTSSRQAAAVIAAVCRPDLPAPAHADAPVRPIANPLRPRRPGPACWNVNLPRLSDNQPPAGVQVAPISTDSLLFDYTYSPVAPIDSCLGQLYPNGS